MTKGQVERVNNNNDRDSKWNEGGVLINEREMLRDSERTLRRTLQIYPEALSLSNPTPVSLHPISSHGHPINDVFLFPLEPIRSKRESVRKAREAQWY